MKAELIKAFLVCFIGMNVLYAQKIELIKDSVQIQKFNDYVDYILSFEKDSAVSLSFHSKYRILYRAVRSFTVFGSSENLIVDDTFICRENPCIVMDTALYSIHIDRASKSNKKETPPLMLDKSIFGMNAFKAVSYNMSRFVIIEKSYILNIGDYTSTGETATFFLEKAE